MEQASDLPLPPDVEELLQRQLLWLQVDRDRLDSALAERFADATTWPDALEVLEQSALGRFDLLAQSFAPFAVSSDPTAFNPLYERSLIRLEESILKLVSDVLQHMRADARGDFTSRIALKLKARTLALLAEAKLRHLEESHHSSVINTPALSASQALSALQGLGPNIPVPSNDEAANSGAKADESPRCSATWADVRIDFISDNSAQMTVKDRNYPPQNYGEMGGLATAVSEILAAMSKFR